MRIPSLSASMTILVRKVEEATAQDTRGGGGGDMVCMEGANAQDTRGGGGGDMVCMEGANAQDTHWGGEGTWYVWASMF